MYNELYKAWKSEITSQETQPLPEDFYQKAEAYLTGTEQEAISADEHTAKGRLLLKEKEVMKRLLRELKEVRLRKILASAQNGQEISSANLTEEERKFAQGFDTSLQAFREVRSGPIQPAPAETVEVSVVRFLEDLPEIVGTDLKIYGPYKKEDVGSLPSQNATALIKQGAAKEIQVHRIVRSEQNAHNAAINNK